MDRLNNWEIRVAADYYRILSATGLHCLNDPARIPARFELLTRLQRAGINPHGIHMASLNPQPRRFPVFVRFDDHGPPITPLLFDQTELDTALKKLSVTGTPMQGAMVVEFHGQEHRPGYWAKWGAFRVGNRYSLDHIAVDDNWLVKYGKWELLSEEIVCDEHEAVEANLFLGNVRRAFEAADIQYGRADFGIFDGQPAFYEINTNPYVAKFVPDPIPKRLTTQKLARHRLAEAFSSIDTHGTGWVRIRPSPLLKFYRGFMPGFLAHQRP